MEKKSISLFRNSAWKEIQTTGRQAMEFCKYYVYVRTTMKLMGGRWLGMTKIQNMNVAWKWFWKFGRYSKKSAWNLSKSEWMF